jgi:hypothetical protein
MAALGEATSEDAAIAIVAAGGLEMSLLQAFTRTTKTASEQRRSQREHVRFPAWIDARDGTPLHDCTVLDVCEDGARIEGVFPAELPEQFDLVLNKEGTRRRHCRMVWRSDRQIGLSYISPLEWHQS